MADDPKPFSAVVREYGEQQAESALVKAPVVVDRPISATGTDPAGTRSPAVKSAVTPSPVRTVSRVADLTEREMQVLHLLSHGLENREIGRRLSTTEDTIKTHNRNLFRKLGAASRAHAVRRGFEQGLLRAYSDSNVLKFDARPTPPPQAEFAVAARECDPKQQLYAALESLGWSPPGGAAR